MSRRRRGKVASDLEESAELNIMPFIDVFSVLNTFLLMSAVFLSVGIIKVQIPFFTNKPPNEKPKRSLTVNVDVMVDKILFNSSYTAPPTDAQKFEYPLTPAGIDDLHKRLVETRQKEPENDLVTLFSDDDVTYEDLAKVLDSIKMRRAGDPDFNNQFNDDTDDAAERANNKMFIYPKVVMGSVIL